MYFSGSGHLHTQFGPFPFTKGLEGDSAAPLGDDGREAEEEEDKAMVGGWRKMAVGAMLARE